MKNKILPFIIGLLIGAIIASTGFAIYLKTNRKNRPNSRGTPPQMNQSQDSNNNGGTPPELPNGEKPEDSSNGETTENSNANSTDTQNSEQTQSNS